MSESVLLPARQQKFLAALLTSPTVLSAAAACNIPRRTAYNWLRDATFKAAYAQARQELIDETRNGLVALSQEALTRLHAIIRDPDAPIPSVVKAIEMITARILDMKHEEVLPVAANSKILDLSLLNEDEKKLIERVLEQAEQRSKANQQQQAG
jgi:hypothetical protein